MKRESPDSKKRRNERTNTSLAISPVYSPHTLGRDRTVWSEKISGSGVGGVLQAGGCTIYIEKRSGVAAGPTTVGSIKARRHMNSWFCLRPQL